MARPRKPLLSSDRIVETARALVDAEGLDALSTRRLAAELGVSGPSLYNHFPTKDEILDAVADAVIGEVDLSMFEDGRDWRTRCTTGPAPTAPPWPPTRTSSRSSPRAPAAGPPRCGGRRGLRRLVDAGWPPAQATHIGALMRYFVTGSALGSFARGFVDDAGSTPADYPHLGQAHLLAEHQARRRGRLRDRPRALLDGLDLRYRRTVSAG